MQVIVGTTPIKLPIRGNQTPTLFNNGSSDPASLAPDDDQSADWIVIGPDENLTLDNGYPVFAGYGYEFVRDLNTATASGELYALSNRSTDLRILVIG